MDRTILAQCCRQTCTASKQAIPVINIMHKMCIHTGEKVRIHGGEVHALRPDKQFSVMSERFSGFSRVCNEDEV